MHRSGIWRMDQQPYVPAEAQEEGFIVLNLLMNSSSTILLISLWSFFVGEPPLFGQQWNVLEN